MNLVFPNVQIHQNIKPENSKNRRKPNRRAKEKRRLGATPATTGRGVHHGQAVVTAARGGGGCLGTLRFGMFSALPWAAGFAFSCGILGLFASFF